MPICTECQTNNPSGSEFCDGCGASLEGGADIAASAAISVAQSPSIPAEAQQTSSGGYCADCGTQNPSGAEFCDGCGANLISASPLPGVSPMPQPPSAPGATPSLSGITRVKEARSSMEFVLPNKDQILMGRRDPETGVFPDIDLTDVGALDAGVSRRHCMIYQTPTGTQIEDLGSVNYTHINGIRLAPGERREVAPQSEVLLGDLKLIFS